MAFVIDLTLRRAIAMTHRQTTAAALLLTFALGAPAFAANGVPRLNVGPTCHPIDRSDKSIQIDTERCLKTESDAREQLVRQWADFPATDRTLCTQTATLTSMASYVDLLTCLEMKRDVAKLPADRGLRTAPAALPTTPRSAD
jgi:hypothetical protein